MNARTAVACGLPCRLVTFLSPPPATVAPSRLWAAPLRAARSECGRSGSGFRLRLLGLTFEVHQGIHAGPVVIPIGWLSRTIVSHRKLLSRMIRPNFNCGAQNQSGCARKKTEQIAHPSCSGPSVVAAGHKISALLFQLYHRWGPRLPIGCVLIGQFVLLAPVQPR